MADFLQSEKSYVSHLRVRGAGLDPLVTRLRMENLLSATRLHPSGLAPSAIVCIRNLRTRLYGPLQLRQSGSPPPSAWEQAVVSKLSQLARHAVRPARGAIRTEA